MLLHTRRSPLLDNIVQLPREAALDLLGCLVFRGRNSPHSDVPPPHQHLAYRRIARKLLLPAVEEGACLLEYDGSGLGSVSWSSVTHCHVPCPASGVPAVSKHLSPRAVRPELLTQSCRPEALIARLSSISRHPTQKTTDETTDETAEETTETTEE